MDVNATPTHTVQLPVGVIINTAAGALLSETDPRQRITDLFRAHGMDVHVWVVRRGCDLDEYIGQAVRSCPTVVAGGGDGTVSSVAAAVVARGATLGVLPLGTLNHFAKDLDIPMDLEAAVRSIAEGEVDRVDVGEVNGRVFINNSSLGLYPSIVHHRKHWQERLGWRKWPAFIWAALTVLRRYPFLSLRLETEEVELVRRTPFVFIGNNEYQVDILNIGRRACLSGGQLSLYVTRRAGRLELLWLVVRALRGRLREAKDFDALRTRRVRVETRRRRLAVTTDGELTVMNTPLHYRIRPGALRVIVPRRESR